MTENRLLWAGLVVAVGVGGARADASDSRPLYEPGEVIVQFERGLGSAEMDGLAARAHSSARVERTLANAGRPEVALVRFPAETPLETMLSRLRGVDGVAQVEPNYYAYAVRPRLRTSTRAAAPLSAATPDSTVASLAAPAPANVHYRRVPTSGAPFPNDPADPEVFVFAPGSTFTLSGLEAFYWIDTWAIWPDKAVNPMVAVLSTGVEATHPDLAGRIVKGKDYIYGGTTLGDDEGTGTRVAGVISALPNNAKGTIGVSTAKILSMRVLDTQGRGTYFDIATAITDAANNAAVKVIYCGFTGSAASPTLQAAVQAAVDKDKLIVAPAGDEYSTAPEYPAYYARASFSTLSPQVISVASGGLYPGSLDPDTRYTYSCGEPHFALFQPVSNYGDWITLTAPGDGATTWRGGGVSSWGGGTLQAAAMAAGAASRVFSAMPGASAADVKARLVATGRPLQLGPTFDFDNNGTLETSCWSAAMNPAARDLDVAAAMYRTAIFGRADAVGGGTLAGATITATLGSSTKGTTKVLGALGNAYYLGASISLTFNYALLDLPMDAVDPFFLAVNKAGYTVGAQAFASVLADDCGGGGATSSCVVAPQPEPISVPRNVSGLWHMVTDTPGGFPTAFPLGLDQFLFTPSSGAISCGVGTPAATTCGLGSLTTAPFARWLVDGGWGKAELTSFKPVFSTATGTPYELFLRDYNSGNDLASAPSTVRLWAGGKIQAVLLPSAGDTATHDCTIGGGAVACDTYYVGDVSSAGVFTPKGIFGTFTSGSGGVLPYSAQQMAHATAAGSR